VNDSDAANGNVFLEIDTSDGDLKAIYTIDVYATATNVTPVAESTHI
jgi:hypothetical protein